MSKTQRLLLMLMIVVIIIIIIVILLYLFSRKDDDEREYEYDFIEEIEPEEKIAIVSTRNEFYVVKDCVNKFYTYSAMVSNMEEYYGEEVDNQEIKEEQNENAQVIYNMLDKEYIEARQITKTNILSKLDKLNSSIIDITKMYVSEKNSYISVFIVEGTLRAKRSNEMSNFKLIVKFDISNETFSIIPQDYVEEKFNNIKLGDTIDIEVPENIEFNGNNKYIFKVISNEIYVTDLLKQYKEAMIYNRKLAYDNLDSEYRKKKFDSLSNFEKYIDNKYKNINAITIDSYQYANMGNETQYVVLDKTGNYYIFQETAPMQYDVILDTYTIDIPEFTQKYTASLPQEKVMLNLNKFMLAINDKDYKYAYGVLADSFKANNFTSLKAFQEYVEKNFFDTNVFEYLEFGDEAGAYYTYKVRISDGVNKKITKTFVMRLGEGTEFEVAFDV